MFILLAKIQENETAIRWREGASKKWVEYSEDSKTIKRFPSLYAHLFHKRGAFS